MEESGSGGEMLEGELESEENGLQKQVCPSLHFEKCYASFKYRRSFEARPLVFQSFSTFVLIFMPVTFLAPIGLSWHLTIAL